MGLFAILLFIMAKNSIFDAGIHRWYLCSLFSLDSEKSQEILGNLNKALEKHLGRVSMLEKLKVFNQDLSICRKTDTALVLKLDIDFISLWDDVM